MLSIVTWFVQAQQLPKSTFFYLNPQQYNPAYTGFAENTTLFTQYRLQMAGLPNSPTTLSASLDMPLPDYKAGLGVMLTNDIVNIIGQTGGRVSYAYYLTLAKDQHVGFGLSMGVNKMQILYDRIVADEPSELTQVYNYKPFTSFNSDIGIMYEIYDLEVGFSVNNLFSTRNNVYFNQLPYRPLPQYGVMFRSKYDVDMDWTLITSGSARSPQGSPIVYDFNIVGQWREWGWVGLNYGKSNNIGLILGGKKKNLSLIYAWEFPFSALSKTTFGAHELMIRYAFEKPIK